MKEKPITVSDLVARARLVDDDPFSRRLLTEAQLPFMYWGFTSDDVKMTDEQKEFVNEWIETFVVGEIPHRRIRHGQFGWFIHGGLGSGKTMIAVAIAKGVVFMEHDGHVGQMREDVLLDDTGVTANLHALHPRVAFWNWAEVLALTLTENRMGWLGTRRARMEQDFSSSDLLVLDNVGVEYPGQKQWDAFLLERMLRDRVQTGMPMILASNLNPKEFEKRYGPVCHSLVAGYFHSFSMNGEDFRTNFSAQNFRSAAGDPAGAFRFVGGEEK